MPRQFQLRTLLFVVAFCALGTWWVMRPCLTAQWFVTEGYKIIPTDREDSEYWQPKRFREAIEQANEVEVTPRKRSWRDVLVAKQSFSVHIGPARYFFGVTRGTITTGPYLYGYGRFTFVF